MYKIARILLKDGTFLRASIFGDLNINNESIQDVDLIHAKFLGDKLIAFQTELINGHFHPENVLWYDIIYE